jgi:RNA polymerase sigma-32 factor
MISQKVPMPGSKNLTNTDDDTRVNKSDTALVKYDILQRYLAEINKYPLLTREEERALALRFYAEEDKDAAYKMITSNLRLVVKIAMEFQRAWMQNLMDLIQEGNIGLLQALNKFDPYRGIKFSYYSSFWIKAYILKFIMDNWRLVKIGTTQAQRKLFFKLRKEKQRLIAMGFDPGPKLLSEKLGVPEGEIIEMDQRLTGWEVSLDAPVKDGSEDERISLLPAPGVSAETRVGQEEIKRILGEKLEKFRAQLNDRELQIFDNRIFSDSPLTLQDLGDRYHISRERIRQIEKNIIKKLRDYFKKEIPDLESYREGLSVNATNLR